ncbi:MAG TPA: universal stress protein [Bosea sp. (in: a-proteobacteria)]
MNNVASLPKAGRGARAPVSAACKDIVVHLDGTAEDEIRLSHAEHLAAQFDARLTGLFTNVLPDPALYIGEFGTMALGQLTEAMAKEGDAVNSRLEQRFALLGVTNELRRIETLPGNVDYAVAAEARWADLFVASCPRGDQLDRWRPMFERVMFDGGRGLYLVPPGAKAKPAIETVMIAWVDSCQATRALAEALPLLKLAKRVCLATVQETAHGRLGGAEALADVAAHLSRHGVEASVNVLSGLDEPSVALLDEAHRISADLLVAGAYGHSRFREWILGGVTENLLATADLPLLLAH